MVKKYNFFYHLRVYLNMWFAVLQILYIEIKKADENLYFLYHLEDW